MLALFDWFSREVTGQVYDSLDGMTPIGVKFETVSAAANRRLAFVFAIPHRFRQYSSNVPEETNWIGPLGKIITSPSLDIPYYWYILEKVEQEF